MLTIACAEEFLLFNWPLNVYDIHKDIFCYKNELGINGPWNEYCSYQTNIRASEIGWKFKRKCSSCVVSTFSTSVTLHQSTYKGWQYCHCSSALKAYPLASICILFFAGSQHLIETCFCKHSAANFCRKTNMLFKCFIDAICKSSPDS